MNLKTNLTKSLCLVLVLCLAGCTQAQVLTDLDIAAAALAAISVVPGIPAPYTIYIADTAQALDCVSAAIETGGTNAQVALAISTCGLSAAAPNIPSGTPTTVIAAITAVITAVQKVIADEQPIMTAVDHGSVQFSPSASEWQASYFGPHGKDKFSLGIGGKNHIKKIRATLAKVKAKFPQKGTK